MQKILPPNAVLIPDTAVRVFTGDIFDVYQWPQEMFDGSTKTFEMLKRPDTVQMFVVRDNKVLLVRDEQPGIDPRLDVPQGRADDQDAAWLGAAQRELREETGLVCKDWQLISVEQPYTKIEWFAALYLVQNVTEELPQRLDPGGEKIELVWMDFKAFRGAILSGTEPTMSYLVPLFSRIATIDELLAMPEYDGKFADR
jgi:ADP-ribose pyrophosphatase